ncbi:AraC family transcriptional regulator [Anaerotruncus rubiinfantis]|uniref:AraC family transcriptional regulator n=1 Tax=Anaerotruncus rubiinfantis TaxID=1720200 RepID=UPI00189742B6|nr:AraC family transcriptional regulator [Anaerotruncus rubiinfantis]
MIAFERKSDINSKPFCLETIHINDVANNMQHFHWHEYMELCYIRSGVGTYYVEDKVFGVKKGDIIIINSSERHKVNFEESNPLYETVIHFYPDLIWAKENSLYEFNRLKDCLYFGSQFVNKQEPYPDAQKDISECIARIEQECIGEHPFYEVVVKAQLLMLLTILARSGRIMQEKLEHPPSEQMKEILEYIQNNLKNDLSLAVIAKQFYMNATYFSSTFKDKMGIGYYNYVVQQRIEDAKKLLERTDYSIIRIAYECGFNSNGSFYNAFKRVAGMSPREYRKKLGKEKASSENADA